MIILLAGCNQKQEKVAKELETKLESNPQSASETKDYLKEIAEFSLNFSPKGAYSLDSIPKDVIKSFKELRKVNKDAHEKYVTLIFTKLYAEHLSCCHQGYLMETFPASKSEYDFDALTMVNEFAFMTNYLEQDELPEAWSSGIIEKWLTENPRLLKYEPTGKCYEQIKTFSKKIENGEFWE